MQSVDDAVLEIQKAAAAFDIEAVAAASTQLVQLMESSVASQPQSFCLILQKAVDEFDFDQARILCGQLKAHLQSLDSAYPFDSAKKILSILRRKRLFPEMISVADNLMQSGSTEPHIKRQYAQALIDTGVYSAAIAVLKQLEADCEAQSNAHELAEAQGLFGRVYKQLYMDAAAEGRRGGVAAQNALQLSFKYYHDQYVREPAHIWHGINAVAVWHRAKLDGVELPVSDININKTTIDILASVGRPPETVGSDQSAMKADMWSLATAAEASIALGDYNSALVWLNHYVDEAYVHAHESDAFEVGSTLRQLEEVWQLDGSRAEQAKVLQILRTALLKREGGSISLDKPVEDVQTIDSILSNKKYEGIFGEEHFKNLRWLKAGFERAQNVCKFVDQFDEAFGTGFLLRSEDLNLPVENKWVILTNAHVISYDALEQRGTPKAISPEKAKVQFEAGADPAREYQIDKILAWSPRNELDFSVLTLVDEGEFDDPYPIASNLPLLEDNQRIYLIGHPRGGQLSFSMYDNKLIDYEVPIVHYRSPSLGGSSGSPVFNQAWELIGLHHAGGTGVKKLNGQTGQYSANEGLWIRSIISAIESKKQDMRSTLA